jgi:hypothetical protein
MRRKARASKKRAAGVQEKVLAQIARAAERCREVEELLSRIPTPELETLIKLHRVLILKFSAEAEFAPELLKLAKDLMKPVMDWARLEEQSKRRELAGRKCHDAVEAEKAARDRTADEEGLRPETLQKIERELKLL